MKTIKRALLEIFMNKIEADKLPFENKYDDSSIRNMRIKVTF